MNTNDSTVDAIQRFMGSPEGDAWMASVPHNDIRDEVPPSAMQTPGWVSGIESWRDGDTFFGMTFYGQTHGEFGEDGARIEQSFTCEDGLVDSSPVRIETGELGPSLPPSTARELALNLLATHDELKGYNLEFLTLADVARWAEEHGEDPHTVIGDVLTGRRTSL